MQWQANYHLTVAAAVVAMIMSRLIRILKHKMSIFLGPTMIHQIFVAATTINMMSVATNMKSPMITIATKMISRPSKDGDGNI